MPMPPYGGRGLLARHRLRVAACSRCPWPPRAAVVVVVVSDVGPVDHEGTLVARRTSCPRCPRWRPTGRPGRPRSAASFSMITAAASPPARESMSIVASAPFSVSVGDLAAGAGDQGVDPDDVALVLVGLDRRPCRRSRAAASMIWSHVTGWLMSMPAFSTKDLRYHSTWVLDQNGSDHELVLPGGGVDRARRRTARVSWSCRSCGISARKPALANSAVNGGSRLIRSMPGSSAASRRASWIRCWLASCGSTWCRSCSRRCCSSRPPRPDRRRRG